ncbi:MAG TPA: thermonuclease family protein [Pyrinomonadaceae bacterium]|nr:thermonuclease family protein [Pyrinomonadaceae bacterium]
MKIFIFFVILVSGLATVNAQEEVTNPEPEKSPKAGSFRKPTEETQKSKELLPGQLKMTFDDGCGNPFAESQTYSYRYGKVLEITSDNKIIVKVVRSNNVWDDEYEKTADGVGRKLKKPQIIIASLVGIDETVNQSEIGKFLLDKVLDQQVTLIGNTKKDDGKKIDALIELTDDEEIDEINSYLLENGMAKFKAFQLTNIVPARTACQLEKVEAKAKSAKLGIWAK